MREHEVSTHVQAEDKVLLWFTFPQIVAVTAVGALASGAYRYAPIGPSEARMALAAVVGLLGVAMTVGKIGGRRLPLAAADLLRFGLGPRRYAGPPADLARTTRPRRRSGSPARSASSLGASGAASAGCARREGTAGSAATGGCPSVPATGSASGGSHGTATAIRPPWSWPLPRWRSSSWRSPSSPRRGRPWPTNTGATRSTSRSRSPSPDGGSSSRG